MPYVNIKVTKEDITAEYTDGSRGTEQRSISIKTSVGIWPIIGFSSINNSKKILGKPT